MQQVQHIVRPARHDKKAVVNLGEGLDKHDMHVAKTDETLEIGDVITTKHAFVRQRLLWKHR